MTVADALSLVLAALKDDDGLARDALADLLGEQGFGEEACGWARGLEERRRVEASNLWYKAKAFHDSATGDGRSHEEDDAWVIRYWPAGNWMLTRRFVVRFEPGTARVVGHEVHAEEET